MYTVYSNRQSGQTFAMSDDQTTAAARGVVQVTQCGYTEALAAVPAVLGALGFVPVATVDGGVPTVPVAAIA